MFAMVNQVKKAMVMSCATEIRKLNGERNKPNARCYFWSKKKRKTKNTLAG